MRPRGGRISDGVLGAAALGGARLLIELAEEKEGMPVISQRLTQQEFASRIGASREMVSRILKDLSTGGYLSQYASTGAGPIYWAVPGE